MNEFAQVLDEIIEQGRRENRFSVRKLAKQARITASYISLLRKPEQSPPIREKLEQIARALREVNTSESDVQRLIEAYNQTQTIRQEQRSLAKSLFHDHKKTVQQTTKQISTTDIVNLFPSTTLHKSFNNGMSIRHHIYHNLPQPNYSEFIGRKTEIARLKELLSPQNRAWVVTIDGIGGIGKSTLALEVAYYYLREFENLSENERFEAIIWISAKTSMLTAEGIVSRHQIDHTLEDVFSTIAITLDQMEITQVLPERQNELILNALTQYRTLLILDNLETTTDEKIQVFLRELPLPTKAIVTTRHRIDVAYSIRLTGMSQIDALELIAQECNKRGIELADSAAKKICDSTGNVPLAIVWSVAQKGYGYNLETVLNRINKPNSDIAQFCFKESVCLIKKKSAYTLLMAMALFAESCSREAIAYVAGFDKNSFSLDESLIDLIKLSLINRVDERFYLLPLTRRFVIGELENNSQFKLSARAKFLEYFSEFWEKHKEADHGKLLRAESQLASQEKNNTLAFIDDLCSQNEWRTAGKLIHNMTGFFYLAGFWTEPIPYIERISDTALRNVPLSKDDRLLLCHLWLDIGYLLCYSESYSYTIKWLHMAKEVIEDLGADDLRCRYLAYQGAIAQKERDFEKAKEIFQKRLDLSKKMGAQRKVLASEYLLAVLELIQNNYTAAEKGFRDILYKAKEVYPRAVPYIRTFLADIAREQGDLEIAEHGYRQAMTELSELYGSLDIRGIAYINAGEAHLEAARENYLQAKNLAQEALLHFSQIGLVEEKNEMKDLLSKLNSEVSFH